MLKAKRSLFASPLSSSGVFVAQATLGESDQPVETHYFVLSADSRLFGIYRSVERPRWAWFFAV